MRLFIAINPTPDARRDWTRAVEPLRERAWPVRWVEPESLHLTLSFLGHVPDERATEISTAIDAVAARTQPFAMHVRGLGAFPSPRRARVLWIGIEPDPPLLALQREVAAAMRRIGFEPEARGWAPHVTVGRVRGDSQRVDGVEEAIGNFRYDAIVPVDGIDLMKSTLTRAGARYERIRRAELGRI